MPDENVATNSEQDYRLLVIDDDLIQRTIISKIGGQTGFDVTAVSTFDDAAKKLTTIKFDCVTLDLSLGSQSGVLLLRTIVDSGHRMPIVVISGAEHYVLTSTVKMAAALGLDASPLAKPLNIPDLRLALMTKRVNAQTVRDLRLISTGQTSKPAAVVA